MQYQQQFLTTITNQMNIFEKYTCISKNTGILIEAIITIKQRIIMQDKMLMKEESKIIVFSF